MLASQRLFGVSRSSLVLFRGIHHESCCATGPDNFVRAQTDGKEYAFEMTNSTLRFGVNVTQEIGQDLRNLNAKRTLIVTDTNVAKTHAFEATLASLKLHNVPFTVYDQVKVEPTDTSVRHCIETSINGSHDAYVAVGGGSVIDTAKCAALFVNNPDNDLYDFASKPLGREGQPNAKMSPLIAVPTTAGTGSETTSTAIFDCDEKRVKSGIRNRAMKPHLAIIDPLNVRSMPREVAVYSAFDILCHAVESYTARPFYERVASDNPRTRAVYQGSNPISDVWCRQAMHILNQFFLRSIDDQEDIEAHANMMLAACYGGMGFGNAGTHLPHGLSYALSGRVRSFQSKGYQTPANKPCMIPHGLSVVMTAPAVFEFTGQGCPSRHVEAAQLLGGKELQMPGKEADIGHVLADHIRSLMQTLKVPNGLRQVNFDGDHDLDMLSETALLAGGALKLSPIEPNQKDLRDIFERSLKVY